jgi:putative SOS response-associated peptidase YedK
MCGRVRLSSDVSEIRIAFRIPSERPLPNFPPSWNVAPTDSLPVVRFDAKAGQRSLDMLRWGLIPYWAKDINVGFANINAKAEGIESKPAFRKAFERRRCLVPVDNFTSGRKRRAANSLMRSRSPIAASWRWPGYGRTGARLPANGCAPSRSSPTSRTNCAASSTTGWRLS